MIDSCGEQTLNDLGPVEERLRATAGVTGTVALSSWRGRSGRRYVVGIHPMTERAALDVVDAVLIAAARDPNGIARFIGALAAGGKSLDRSRLSWVRGVRGRGATELHVHRLADCDSKRTAVIADLRAPSASD